MSAPEPYPIQAGDFLVCHTAMRFYHAAPHSDTSNPFRPSVAVEVGHVCLVLSVDSNVQVAYAEPDAGTPLYTTWLPPNHVHERFRPWPASVD